MRPLSNLSIKHKLTVITMLTTGLALMLACAAFAIHDISTFRQSMLDGLRSDALTLGVNTTAAISFADAKDAASVLASLRADPQVIHAAITTPDGTLFASYIRDPGGRIDPDRLDVVAGHRFDDQWVDLATPIIHDGRQIGMLHIRAETGALRARLHRYAAISFIVLLVSLAAAFGASFPLQRIVTRPLQHLSDVARRVTAERNYELRAQRSGDDEIGQLTGCFNEMLAQIQERDRQLQNHRDHLEDLVALRTDELCSSNADLAAARDRAEEASRAKSAFLANMSHEIRTPMTAMIGYADLLLYPDQSPGDRMDCIQTIRRNGEHLLAVINDILDLSKIEAGCMSVERIACSLFQIVSEVSSLMRVRAIEKDLQLRVDYIGPIPATIQTDPTRLRQVLMNLISNAIKFTEAGEVRLYVRMDPASDGAGAQLRFDVSDTGIGLSAEQQSRLFNAFQQADDSMTRRFGGTGLGLAISRRLAEMLGGRISVSSAPGAGSTFTVTVDCGDMQGMQMIADGREGCAGAHDPPRPRAAVLHIEGRILLAEDGLDNQRLVCFLLKRAGATVEVASNGRIACEKVLEAVDCGRPFDLVLMDMQMPEMDGYQATRELRGRGVVIPIIALTAHAMADDRAKCLSAGCTDFLTKPIDRDRLLSTIDHHLQHPVVPASPAAGSDAPVAGALRSEYADDPDMRPIIDSFISMLPARASEMRALLEQRNAGELRRAVHQIKGAGGGYGFAGISVLAAEVEAILRAGRELDEVGRGVAQLIDLIRTVDGYDRTLEYAHVA